MADNKLLNAISDATFLTGVGFIFFSAILGFGVTWHYTNLKAKEIYNDVEAQKKTD